MNKLQILQDGLDILAHQDHIIRDSLLPLSVSEIKVKDISVPTIERPDSHSKTLQEINQLIVLELFKTSPEFVQERYTAICLDCRDNRTKPEYQELIGVLCETFEEAFNLIFGDIEND